MGVISHGHLIEPEYELIGAIIKQALLEVGSAYARCPDGVWWMSSVGLSPGVVYGMGGGRGKWNELDRCRCLGEMRRRKKKDDEGKRKEGTQVPVAEHKALDTGTAPRGLFS